MNNATTNEARQAEFHQMSLISSALAGETIDLRCPEVLFRFSFSTFDGTIFGSHVSLVESRDESLHSTDVSSNRFDAERKIDPKAKFFSSLGEIDTLNEKYQASAAIESRWSVPLDQLLPSFSFEEQQRLSLGKSISLPKYSEAHWHPQLFIENSLGDLKETIRYSAKVSDDRDRIFVCEHREIKGLFWEKLELHHFPSDIQELSISIGSMLYNDKVMLVSDPYHPSGINREAFVDQQEWSLYEHVDTQQRFIKEFLFRDDDDSEENLEENQEENAGATSPAAMRSLTKEKHRPVLTVTCHAGQTRLFSFPPSTLVRCSTTIELFLLEWLLSGSSHHHRLVLHFRHSAKVRIRTSGEQHLFSRRFSLAANRLQISCTLLLTSITFRWTVNRSLVRRR